MGDTVLQNTKVAVEKEITEGTLVLPSAGASFFSPLEDGANDLVVNNKEGLERTNLNASLDKSASRSGIKSVSGTIPVEFKAGDSGAAPEYAPFIESALGSTSAGSTGNTSSTGHTTTVINFAATAPFSVGDIVLVKESGAYHVSPITTVTTDTSITLLVAASAAFSDTVEVDVLVKYDAAESGHPSLSITKYVEDEVRETAAGAKVTSMAMENWTTGQQPTLSFGYEGLSYTTTLNTIAQTPEFDDALPVVALSACVYQDGVSIPVNEANWSLENTLGYKTSTCSPNGRIGSRVTSRAITGSINPYKQDDSIADFTKWDEDTTFSLFGWAGNPTGTDGEYDEIVSWYIPSCQFTEIAQTDQDGLLQNTLTFAGRKDESSDALPAITVAYG